ncbi:hypothetical protein [Buttiauxella gaviniae]|uniref:hypothetical protein n=1 Tax=Buttiauxella gaviniae TaxID=82990 RepID=UPI003975C762
MNKSKCSCFSVKKVIFIVVAITSILFIRCTFANTITCGGSYTSVGGDYAVPPVNITAPNNGESSKLLYTVNDSTVTAAYSDCRGGGSWINTSNTLMDIPPGEIYTIDGYTVYPTNIKGIGISINESTSGSDKPVPVWPAYIDTVTRYNNMLTTLRTNIRLWKTPGFTPPIGATQITSLTSVSFIRAMNAGDTIGTCPPGGVRMPNNNNVCKVISRRITLTAFFQLGTCELLNPNQTVQMGTYHTTPVEKGSPWVDASFQLKCPQAWGYGGSTKTPTNFNDAGNGTKTANSGNQPIKIKITPINPIVNPSQGTFKLNEGGAEGYDLQLAWGTPTSQGAIPAKPVQLGSWVNASSLNSNYSAVAYAIGANALPNGADGKINMSARYLRNSQDVNAGVANASVEVLATYE